MVRFLSRAGPVLEPHFEKDGPVLGPYLKAGNCILFLFQALEDVQDLCLHKPEIP